MITKEQVKEGAIFAKNNTRYVVTEVVHNQYDKWVFYVSYFGSFREPEQVRTLNDFLEFVNERSCYLKSA